MLKLPLWARWNTEDVPAVAAQAELPLPRYTLHSMRGDQLTSLYPIEVTEADLGQLAACLDLLVGIGHDSGAGSGSRPSEGEGRLADVFGVSWRCCCCRLRRGC